MKGMDVAYCTVGSLILYSGVKGASLQDTAKAVLSGNLTLNNTQSIKSGAPAAAPAAGVANNPVDSQAITNVGAGESSFIDAVLQGLGAPLTSANRSSLQGWFKHEFPSWPPFAANNPMATTQSEPGATTYNPQGVKNYPDAATGVKATVTTLDNGRYPAIVMALRSGQGLAAGNSQVEQELLVWSGGGYSSV